MFDLEARLDDWKNRLRRREALSNDNIEELEQHVRDAIAERMASGLSEQDAFWVATGRIGETDTLAREFGRVNGGRVWAQRVFWMLAGFLVFEVSRSMIAALSTLGMTLAASAGVGGTGMGWIAAGLSVLGWCAFVLFLHRSYDSLGKEHALGRFFADSRGS